MKQNQNRSKQFQEKLKKLTVDDLLLIKLIDNLGDEAFAASFAKAHNLNTPSPDYRPVN